jgi:hypothetical protein
MLQHHRPTTAVVGVKQGAVDRRVLPVMVRNGTATTTRRSLLTAACCNANPAEASVLPDPVGAASRNTPGAAGAAATHAR